MFTITLINSTESKTVISAQAYNVTKTREGSNIRVWPELKGDYSEDFLVEPNNDDAFEVAYVTNLAGKTIDRIGGV